MPENKVFLPCVLTQTLTLSTQYMSCMLLCAFLPAGLGHQYQLQVHQDIGRSHWYSAGAGCLWQQAVQWFSRLHHTGQYHGLPQSECNNGSFSHTVSVNSHCLPCIVSGVEHWQLWKAEGDRSPWQSCVHTRLCQEHALQWLTQGYQGQCKVKVIHSTSKQ